MGSAALESKIDEQTVSSCGYTGQGRVLASAAGSFRPSLPSEAGALCATDLAPSHLDTPGSGAPPCRLAQSDDIGGRPETKRKESR
jgi:hypothetical protein